MIYDILLEKELQRSLQALHRVKWSCGQGGLKLPAKKTSFPDPVWWHGGGLMPGV